MTKKKVLIARNRFYLEKKTLKGRSSSTAFNRRRNAFSRISSYIPIKKSSKAAKSIAPDKTEGIIYIKGPILL